MDTTELVPIVGVIAIGAAVVSLLLTLRKAGKQTAIRPGFEVARIVLGVGGVLIIGMVSSVTTPAVLAALAVAAGVLVGFVQGRTLDVTVSEGRRFARRTVGGIVVWFGALIAMQAAGIANRAGALRIGQAVALFGVAVTAGLIAGRRSPAQRPGGRVPVGISAWLLVLVVLIAGLLLVGPRVGRAEAQSNELCSVLPPSPDGVAPSGVAQIRCSVGGVDTEFTAFVEDEFSDRAARERVDSRPPYQGANYGSYELGDVAFTRSSNVASSEEPPPGEPPLRDTSIAIVWARGPFYAEVKMKGTFDESTIAVAAMAMDQRMAEYLRTRSDAPPPGDTGGSSTDEDTAGEELFDPPLTGSEPPDPFDDVSGGAEFGGGGEDRQLGGLGAGTITPEEAIAQAIATALVAAAMGVLTMTEAMSVIDLGRRGDSVGAMDRLDELLTQERPETTFEPIGNGSSDGEAPDPLETPGGSPGSRDGAAGDTGGGPGQVPVPTSIFEPIDQPAPPSAPDPVSPVSDVVPGVAGGSADDHAGGADGPGGDEEPRRPGSADVPDVPVSDQEIADIYERGLASGRSLDDLREDIAGLNRARGGSGDVGNPLGLDMRETDVGPVPLTPEEYEEYRRAQRELAELLERREGLDQQWRDLVERRERLVGGSPTGRVMDVWNAESQFRDRIDGHEEWIETWNEWERGNRWRVAPDGSSYGDYYNSADPDFSSSSPIIERARHQQAIHDIRTERVDYMEQAEQRNENVDRELAALDREQAELIEMRMVEAGGIGSEINAARATIDRYQSYAGGGRPLPST